MHILRPEHITKLRTAVFALALLALLVIQASAQGPGGVKGKVRNIKGDGIPGATVVAKQGTTEIKQVTANQKGQFVLDGLDAGVYDIVFDAPGYSSGTLFAVHVRSNNTSDLGERLILSTDRGAQVFVNGSVFFREGTSVTAARVDVEKVNDDGSVEKIGSTTTNVGGEFTFRRPRGAAKLRITAHYNGVSGTKDIEVSEPGIYRLAITLDISSQQK